MFVASRTCEGEGWLTLLRHAFSGRALLCVAVDSQVGAVVKPLSKRSRLSACWPWGSVTSARIDGVLGDNGLRVCKVQSVSSHQTSVEQPVSPLKLEISGSNKTSSAGGVITACCHQGPATAVGVLAVYPEIDEVMHRGPRAEQRMVSRRREGTKSKIAHVTSDDHESSSPYQDGHLPGIWQARGVRQRRSSALWVLRYV